MSRPGAIPMPSESVVLTLARIASKVQATLVPKPGADRARVSLQTARNDRRRAMESVLGERSWLVLHRERPRSRSWPSRLT